MNELAKLIIGAGLLLVAVGAVILLLGKLGIHPGRLPGDIHVEGGRGSLHFPVVTCLVVSVVLTVLLNLIGRFWR